jgi:hypothetical protein
LVDARRTRRANGFDVILTDNQFSNLTERALALACFDDDQNRLESRIQVPISRRPDCPAAPTAGVPSAWIGLGAGYVRSQFSATTNTGELYAAAASALPNGWIDVRVIGTLVEVDYRQREPTDPPDEQVQILLSNGASASTVTITLPATLPPSERMLFDGFEGDD